MNLAISGRARPLLWFLAALTMFLAAGTAAAIFYQRTMIRHDLSLHMDREVRLLGEVMQDALITRNYVAAQRYLDRFSKDHEEIAQARMIAPNGYVLASFDRSAGAGEILRIYRTVTYGEGQRVTIELAHDLRHSQKRLRMLAVSFTAGSAIFTALIGLLLWRILRTTAFRPLEQAVAELTKIRDQLELRVAERTTNWMLANRELKEEIVVRMAAEQQLMIKDRAIASSINGFALADFEGNLTYVNEAFLGLWGYRQADEVVGRNATEFWLHPEEAAQVMQAIAVSGAWMGELKARRKDGAAFDVQLAADIVKDSAGVPICMMASFIDVTEQKEAAARLRSSEQRLRSITDAVSDVIYRRSSDGTITYASPSVGDVLGFSPEEVVGMNFRDFAHPDDLERAVAVDRRLRDGQPVKDHALRVFRKSGEAIDAEVTLVPLRNEDGSFEVQGILRDVTERKATDAALRASEARIRLIMENINEIIYQVSIADVQAPERASVEFVSGQVGEIVGYDAGAFLKDPLRWFGLVHRDDLPAVAASARRLVQERTALTRTYRICHGTTGEYIWLEDKVVPRLDGQGRIIGYFGVARDITKRMQAEDAMKSAVVRAEEEKNKTSAILAAIGDAISIQDREYKVLYQNEVHKQLIGSHFDELCYRAYEKRDAVCTGCPVALSFDDGKVHTVERQGRTDDGRTVFVEVTASPLRDASGTIIAGIEVARNITPRKKMEQDLRIALETQSVISELLRIPTQEVSLIEVMRQALRLILRSSFYSVHAIGGIFLLDEAANKLSLVAQQGFGEYVQEACKEVALGTCLCGRAAKRQEIEFAADLDERHEIRFPGIQPHGHYCVPILLAGRTVGVLTLYLEQGRSRDLREEEFLRSAASALAVISHRKLMEQERESLIADLRRVLEVVSMSQQEWRETFDRIADPILLVDADRRVRKANRAFASLFGQRPQEVIDHDCLQLLYRGQVPLEDDPIIQGLRSAGQAEGEIVDPVSKRIFRTSVFPSTPTEKELPGVIVVLRDITDEREREMRLIMSERLASLGQMASGIAHEINNPLAAMAGCVDGMSRRISRDQFDPELFTKYLKIIKDEITRSKNITTSMLSVVRKSSYEKKRIDLHAAIDTALEIIGYQGRLRQVEIKRTYEPILPNVIGSEGEIRQVLLILFTNALDAMEDRGVLTIGTGRDGQRVMIDIHNNGPGIPVEMQQRIFDPFFTTKSDKGGTGLGLSIAQRIMTGHNGSLNVLVSDSGGTTFRMTLPC